MCNRSDALYQSVLSDIVRYREVKGMSALDFDIPPSAASNAVDAGHLSLAHSIVKKWLPPKGSCELKNRAIALFKANNELCGDLPRTQLLCTMRYLAFRELPQISWDSLLCNMRFGPGASVLSRGRNSFYEKFFTNPLTTTEPALYTEYRRFMRRRSSWLIAEFTRRRIQGGSDFTVVAGSSLSTVPKTSSIDRTICTEPSLNMLFQLCLGDAFNDVLRKHYGYDPAIQPDRNREAARRGSMGDRPCTIDLKSASDTISLSLCEYVLPSDWFAAVLDCRSPATLIGSERLDLKMVSSMGNGFTFPLQTYIFSLMLRALCLLNDASFSRFTSTEFGVFGDDIIVPASLYEASLEALRSLGFQPNEEKSFGSGPFRESCGTDWFLGQDVRGVYAREASRLPDRFSLINRLNRWSAKNRTPLPETVSSLLPKEWSSFQVPLDVADTAGVKVSRLFHSSPFYTEFSVKRKVFGILRNEQLRKGWDNPYGFVLAASAGALRSGGLDRRQDPTRYVKARSFTPCWDNAISLNRYGIGFADWENYTWLNLTS